jgi:hypothetical protein
MPIKEAIREMEGKVSILDNKKFIGWITIAAVYYLAWLGFLAYMILCA